MSHIWDDLQEYKVRHNSGSGKVTAANLLPFYYAIALVVLLFAIRHRLSPGIAGFDLAAVKLFDSITSLPLANQPLA